MRRLLTLATDVLLVAVALATLALFVQRQGYRIVTDLWKPPYFEVGRQLPANPSLNWGRARQNVVLLVSTHCAACVASAPFHQRLGQQVREAPGARLMAFCSEGVVAGKRYFSDLGLQVEVITLPPLRGRTVRLPMLLLVDSQGKILDSWVGRLEPTQEQIILAKVRGS